jgi:hypothetical protein
LFFESYRTLSDNKTDLHDITKRLLKVTLNTMTLIDNYIIIRHTITYTLKLNGRSLTEVLKTNIRPGISCIYDTAVHYLPLSLSVHL